MRRLRQHSPRTLLWSVILLCVLAVAACSPSTGQSTSITPSARSIGTIRAKIALDEPSDQYTIAVTNTAVWVHNFADGSLLRIDPNTNKVVATIPAGSGPGHVALEAGFIWVLGRDDGVISKIDPQTNQVVDRIFPPPPNAFLAVSPGAVWVASVANKAVTKIDTQTDKVVAIIPIPDGAGWMSYGAGSLWVCGYYGGVSRVNPATNQVTKHFDIGAAQGNQCGTVAALDNTVWVEVFRGGDDSGGSGVLMDRVDPTTNTLDGTSYPLPDYLSPGMVANAQGAWVFSAFFGLYHVDAQSNQVTGPLPIKGGGGLALGDGSVWLATSDETSGTLLRITPTS